MKELEIKDMMARHKQELGDKEATISSVRCCNLSFMCLCFPRTNILRHHSKNPPHGFDNIFHSVIYLKLQEKEDKRLTVESRSLVVKHLSFGIEAQQSSHQPVIGQSLLSQARLSEV